MLREIYAEFRRAEFCNAECHYAECCHAERSIAVCHYTECCNAEMCYVSVLRIIQSIFMLSAVILSAVMPRIIML